MRLCARCRSALKAERDSPVHPLAGIKVIEAASLFAGPLIGTTMADFGAEVVKIEHPCGDGVRSLGWVKDGVSL